MAGGSTRVESTSLDGCYVIGHSHGRGLCLLEQLFRTCAGLAVGLRRACRRDPGRDRVRPSRAKTASHTRRSPQLTTTAGTCSWPAARRSSAAKSRCIATAKAAASHGAAEERFESRVDAKLLRVLDVEKALSERYEKGMR